MLIGDINKLRHRPSNTGLQIHNPNGLHQQASRHPVKLNANPVGYAARTLKLTHHIMISTPGLPYKINLVYYVVRVAYPTFLQKFCISPTKLLTIDIS